MTVDTHSRIAPEPLEAPVCQARGKDFVRRNALAWGWRVMTADGPGLSSLASFRVGVEAYEAYLECHDRRRR